MNKFLNSLNTPKNKSLLLILVFACWLFSLFSEICFYIVEMQRGNDWGSPGLMIFSLIKGWLIGLPLLFAITLISTKGYKGETSLFVWNKTRPYWSSVWTIIFGYFICESAVLITKGVFSTHIEDILSHIFGIFIYLCLRASMLTSNWFIKSSSEMV